MNDKAQAVAVYAKNFKRLQELQATVGIPSFNVDHHPKIYTEYLQLQRWVRDEADRLWHLGVNVY